MPSTLTRPWAGGPSCLRSLQVSWDYIITRTNCPDSVANDPRSLLEPDTIKAIHVYDFDNTCKENAQQRKNCRNGFTNLAFSPQYSRHLFQTPSYGSALRSVHYRTPMLSSTAGGGTTLAFSPRQEKDLQKRSPAHGTGGGTKR